MQQRGPSRTGALNAAVQRAIHQLADDEPKILTDPVVARLVEAAAPGAITAGMETRNVGLPKGGRALVLSRLRFAEDELAKLTLEGVRQYVVLGAGLDTFAYRQPPFAEALHIIEVDHPPTQAWKRASLAAAGIPLPSNLSWAPVGFERDTLSDQLVSAGFDSAQPACFSWLGVTQYLTLPAIDETLRFVAALPSPSTLVVTFIVQESVIPTEEHEALHQILEMTTGVGEPWLTFFHPDDLRARLHELGFARVVHLTPTEANVRYFAGRRDGLQARHMEHVMAATD
jgi:methyltransferase (TIGR00027 family)